MPRRRRIPSDLSPCNATIAGMVKAALIRRPQLSGLCARNEQRSNRTWLFGPAVANALPATLSGATIQPAIRHGSAVRAVWTRRRGHDHDVGLAWIDRHASQIADVEP